MTVKYRNTLARHMVQKEVRTRAKQAVYGRDGLQSEGQGTQTARRASALLLERFFISLLFQISTSNKCNVPINDRTTAIQFKPRKLMIWKQQE